MAETGSPATKVRSRRWLLGLSVSAAAAAMAVAAWYGAQSLTRRSLAAYLPELPELAAEPEARAEQLRQADADARARPDSADTVGRLGMVYFANLDYDRAAVCYQRAAQLDPEGWKWPYCRALLAEELGDGRATAGWFEQVTERKGDWPLAWWHLGQARYKAGDFKAATEALQRAVALSESQDGSDREPRGDQGFPATAHAKVLLARIACRQGDYAAAAGMLEPVTAAAGRFGSARRALAEAYSGLGRDEDAERQQKLAANTPPYTPPVDPLLDELIDLSRSSTFLLKHAGVARNGGRFERALTLLRRAHDYEPHDMEAAAQLADALLAMGRPQEALPIAASVLASHADKAGAMGVMAACCAGVGKGQDAVHWYRRALEARSSDTRYANNLAGLLIQAGQTREAEALLRRTLIDNPDCAEAAANLGRLLVSTNRLDQAIEKLRQAAAIRPENVQMRNDLGAALVMRGRSPEGIREFREALLYDPDAVEVLKNLLSTLLDGGQFGEALPIAKALVRVAPKDAAGHLGWATAAAKLGQREDALGHYRAALDLAPDSAPARQLIEQLQSSE